MKKEIGKLKQKKDGRCAYCGCVLNIGNYTIDHIEPIFRNCHDNQITNRIRGTDDLSNFNPCCRSCNSSKSTFTIESWRDEIKKKFDRACKESSNIRLLLRLNLITYHGDFKFYFESFNEFNNALKNEFNRL